MPLTTSPLKATKNALDSDASDLGEPYLEGVWFEELKFNKYCSTFVLFDKKFPILD
jgi:hypothetical protein